MKESVTVAMSATGQQVFDVVSDITRTGEWSPETFEARWTRGSTGPKVGARFKGHVRRSGRGPVTYWTLCRVTDCEPGKVFAFDVLGPGDRRISNWRYDIKAANGGSDVTQTFELISSPATKIYWFFAGWVRGRYNRKNLTQSLQRIKQIVEA